MVAIFVPSTSLGYQSRGLKIIQCKQLIRQQLKAIPVQILNVVGYLEQQVMLQLLYKILQQNLCGLVVQIFGELLLVNSNLGRLIYRIPNQQEVTILTIYLQQTALISQIVGQQRNVE
ncbi:Hypothetical_protein [Hexamita inflata]|uniref:Hypothetical_protein n=1 Tax=Hexamita inflata TaxID=28002 RepID=A0AA86QSC2_9EUKA|nr:Hypothetical protein HINF_LOCUS50788 [Hexamita inflata]